MKVSILPLLLFPLIVFGCSETESLSRSDFDIKYSQLEDDPTPQEMLIGTWGMSSIASNGFTVFTSLEWLKDVGSLEDDIEYKVRLYFYSNGKWRVMLSTSIAEGEPIFDSTYLVGEYMATESDIMISGGRYGCFSVDKGTYKISGNTYLTLIKSRTLPALVFERVVVEETTNRNDQGQIKLWD